MRFFGKRVSLCYAVVVCAAVLFCSCAGNAPEQLPSEEASEVLSVSEEQPDSSPADVQRVIKLGYSTEDSDPRAAASMEFKNIVEERSKGSLIVELYPEGQLGADKELILGVINGTVDMTVSSAGNFASFANVGISAFPFLFQDFEEAWEFMDSPLQAEMAEGLKAYNIHVLAYFDNGFRCITTSETAGPINSLEDMQGLNIRTSNNQIVMETMSSLGAEPKVMDFTLLYDALKDGSFEAQENPIPVIYNHKLYEVQKYLAVTNHSYDAMPFVIREDLWNSLTEENRQIIDAAAKEVQKLNRELNREQTEEYVALLKDCGMTITYPDLEAFKESSKAVYDYFAPSYGEELMKQILDRDKK